MRNIHLCSVLAMIPMAMVSPNTLAQSIDGQSHHVGYLQFKLAVDPTMNSSKNKSKVDKRCLSAGTKVAYWQDIGDPSKYNLHITDQVVRDCEGKIIPENEFEYVVSNEVLNSFTGRDYIGGLAVIPYKFYYGGKGNISANSATVGYVGLRQTNGFLGINMSLVVLAGISSVSVPDAVSASNVTNITAFTNGLALLGGFAGGNAQYGIAVGCDRVGRDVNWENNGRNWVAIQFGFKFL